MARREKANPPPQDTIQRVADHIKRGLQNGAVFGSPDWADVNLGCPTCGGDSVEVNWIQLNAEIDQLCDQFRKGKS